MSFNWVKRVLRKNRYTAKTLENFFFAKNYLEKKGWFEARFLRTPIDHNKKPLPWFTYSSIHFISNKLKKDMTLFEFGSGNSTIWFSERIGDIVSVEHDREFFEYMEDKLAKIDTIDYRSKELNKDYSQEILKFNKEFDVVVIDGRERVQCAKNCIQALKDDGVIIWDNSDRTEYQEGYDFFDAIGFKKIDFNGLGPIGNKEWRTTIYYRSNNCFNI